MAEPWSSRVSSTIDIAASPTGSGALDRPPGVGDGRRCATWRRPMATATAARGAGEHGEPGTRRRRGRRPGPSRRPSAAATTRLGRCLRRRHTRAVWAAATAGGAAVDDGEVRERTDGEAGRGDDEPQDAEAHPRALDVVDHGVAPSEPWRRRDGAGAFARWSPGPSPSTTVAPPGWPSGCAPDTGGSTATSSWSPARRRRARRARRCARPGAVLEDLRERRAVPGASEASSTSDTVAPGRSSAAGAGCLPSPTNSRSTATPPPPRVLGRASTT